MQHKYSNKHQQLVINKVWDGRRGYLWLFQTFICYKCLTRSNMYFSSWMDYCEGNDYSNFLLFSVLDQYLLTGFALTKFGF